MIVTTSDQFKEIAPNKYQTAVALGFFDGLHLAHQKIIKTVVDEKGSGLLACVHTFSMPPHNIVGNKADKVLTPPDIKTEILNSMQVDYEIMDDFSESIMHYSPEEFFAKILMEKLNAKLIAVGFHYRFGYLKQGDAHILQDLGKKYNVKVIVAHKMTINNHIISSSYIRKLLNQGNIQAANQFLGYRFFMRGSVQNGKQIGRTMNLRTANIEHKDEYAIPKNGVYITQCLIDGIKYRSLTNIGYNPTVGGEHLSVETHLLDYNGDLYGRPILIEFVDRIRDEIRFSSKEALKAQIFKDIEYTKYYKMK